VTFPWSEFSRLASWLVDEGSRCPSEEAAHRSAISRAYYAAFRTALDWGERRKLLKPTGTGADHEAVIGTLRRQVSPVAKRTGVQLDRLRRQRARADYEAVFLNVAREARAAVAEADSVLQQLGRL
jgi:uncharacterized protein (UPF0332 family)